MLKKYQYSVTSQGMEKIQQTIIEMESQKGINFANARDIRNYFEKIITRQAVRVASIQNPSKSEIMLIQEEDC